MLQESSAFRQLKTTSTTTTHHGNGRPGHSFVTTASYGYPYASVVYHKVFKKSMEVYYFMKKISVREFKEYCSKHEYHNFVLDSSNQIGTNFPLFFNYNIVFDHIVVWSNPNTIILTNKCGAMRIHMVKYIKLSTKKSALGRVITVVYGDYNNPDDENYYVFIIRDRMK